jgi:glycosyltransferase involved in cell wall biosynthesis
MRVLYLVPQPKRPGQLSAYTFIDEEIHALAAAGVDAFVLSTRATGDTEIGSVKLRSLPSSGSLRDRAQTTAFALEGRAAIPVANVWHARELFRAMAIQRFAAEIVDEEGIDLIHSHFGWPGSFGGMLAAAATNRPLVACLRGADILLDGQIEYGRRSHPFHDRAIRRLLAAADRTVYFSAFMRTCAVALGAPLDRTRVVEKGVDRSRFQPAKDRQQLKRDLNLPERPMLLTVGGLIPRKGVHLMLEAAARLRDTHDFSIVVCGDGGERGRLQELSETLDISNRTYFLGRVDRDAIPDYFAACDVFVLASTLEAAGNVLLEAMASARPVVCMDSGGPPEYVEDGKTGFVVPVSDVKALADRIRLLLDDPALAEELGRHGRAIVDSRLDSHRMTLDVLRIYDEVTADSIHPSDHLLPQQPHPQPAIRA